MTLFAHISDVHLGAEPYRRPDRYEDIFSAFEYFVEYVIREHVRLVLIAGDLFDQPRPDNRTLRRAYSLLRRLSEAGVTVVAAHGEHDTPGRRDEDTPLTLLSALLDGFKAPSLLGLARRSGNSVAAVASYFTLSIGGLTIHVAPFTRQAPDKRKELLEELFRAFDAGWRSRRRVLLGHFSLEHEFPLDTVKIPLASLPSVSYAALGHIHRGSLNTEAKPAYGYPGVVEPLKIDEAMISEDRRSRFFLVDVSGDEPWVDIVRIPVRRSEVIDGKASRVREVEAILSEVKRRASKRDEKGRPPVVYVRLGLESLSIAPVTVYEKLASIERETKATILASVKRVGGAGSGGGTVRGTRGSLDLTALLSSEFCVSEEEASLIVNDIVSALADEGDQALAASIIEGLLKKRGVRFWESIARGASPCRKGRGG